MPKHKRDKSETDIEAKKAKNEKIQNFSLSFREQFPKSNVINAYTIRQLEGFYKNLKKEATKESPRLYGIDVNNLKKLMSIANTRDGTYWYKYVYCLVSHLKPQKTSHPRYQTRVPPKEKEYMIKKYCSVKELDCQVKLAVHHISYIIAHEKELDFLGSGSGNSKVVEHLCDVKGCFRKGHINPVLVTPKQNVDRANSRCKGWILVVANGVIITEKCLCNHHPACVAVSVVAIN